MSADPRTVTVDLDDLEQVLVCADCHLDYWAVSGDDPARQAHYRLEAQLLAAKGVTE